MVFGVGVGSFSSGLDCRPFKLSIWDFRAGDIDSPFFSDGKVYKRWIDPYT
jgi:hypothetical protein